MGTYLDLQTNIANDLTRSDLTSQIKSAVQDAIKFYETSRFDFNTTRSMTFQTVIGRDTYGVADLAQIPNIIKIDHLFLPIPGSTIYELDFEEPDAFEWLAGSSPGTGKPTVYTYVDSQIMLWPVPTAIYTLRPHMHYRLSTLSADSDSNAWCNQGEMLIRAQAKQNLYANVLEDNDGLQRMQLQIPAYKSKLDYENAARSSSGRITGTDF